MHFLVTNDDGIQSPALEQLRVQLSAFGRVTVIAPDRNQSATSQALTLHRPLRIHPVADDVWTVDGTPADCVLVAFHGNLIERPTFVVSGINHGPNMGEDVFYSGTVGAAIEGALQGVPAIAASPALCGPVDMATLPTVDGTLTGAPLFRITTGSVANGNDKLDLQALDQSCTPPPPAPWTGGWAC